MTFLSHQMDKKWGYLGREACRAKRMGPRMFCSRYKTDDCRRGWKCCWVSSLLGNWWVMGSQVKQMGWSGGHHWEKVLRATIFWTDTAASLHDVTSILFQYPLGDIYHLLILQEIKWFCQTILAQGIRTGRYGTKISLVGRERWGIRK